MVTPQDNLLVGTNGWVLLMGFNKGGNLDTKWKRNLDSGSNITSVVWGVGRAYGGCNGKFYALNAETGEVKERNELKDMGNQEVRMALWDGKLLHVGTNGWAMGLEVSTFRELYKKNLGFMAGSDVTDVLVDKHGLAYYGTNGKLYVIEGPGNLIE